MAFSPHALRAFVVVAEEMHYGRAAKRLHTSQPPLSRTIQRLEEDVGARLFDRRQGWGIELTEAGRYFLERARNLLVEGDHVRVVARNLARGDVGLLAIGYTPTATYELLPPVLREYRRRFPDVVVELVEMRSALLPDAILAGRVHVGFACGPLAAEGIVEEVVVEERFVAALPRRHPLAAKRSLRARDLEGEPLVLVNPSFEPAWATACTSALARAGVQIAVEQLTDSKIAMLGLVSAGVGASLVSESMQALRRDGVVFKPIADLKVEVPLVSLVPDRQVSVRATELLALVRPTHRVSLRRGRSRS